MNLTRRRSAVAAAALVSALVLPAVAASTADAAPAARAACGVVGAYTQPVLVLVSNVTIKGGNVEHITVVNTLPCSSVKLRVYHAGKTLFTKTLTSDANGKAIFSYTTPTNKNRLLFGGFFPAEVTGTTQLKVGGAFLKFDKKTKFFVS